jgi:hypothetical protein
MAAKRIDIKETVAILAYPVAISWPRPTTGQSIPWMFGKQQSTRIQYDDPIMEFHAFGRGPIGYWMRGDEAVGEFTLECRHTTIVFTFTDENTAFGFKMRFG